MYKTCYDVPWCNQLFPIPFSEPDVSTRVVALDFPFHSSWFARWKWRTWSSRTVLSLLSGGVKFSKSHFPEISMGTAKVDLLQRLKRAATDNACTSTRIFLPCKLILISEDYLDFCLVIVICEIFHCFEHNLDCLYVERSKRLCWQGNFLRHSREKYGGKYESRFIYIRSNEI